MTPIRGSLYPPTPEPLEPWLNPPLLQPAEKKRRSIRSKTRLTLSERRNTRALWQSGQVVVRLSVLFAIRASLYVIREIETLNGIWIALPTNTTVVKLANSRRPLLHFCPKTRAYTRMVVAQRENLLVLYRSTTCLLM